jgi:hypothetical protein
VNVEIPRIAMAAVLLVFVLLAAWSLWKVERDPKAPDLLDLLTTTDRRNKLRFDSRKCFEAGAFLTSSWAFVYLTLTHQLTEWFFVCYIGAWVAARSMRDREQRLSGIPKSAAQ